MQEQTIARVIADARKKLIASDGFNESAKLDAEILLADALACDRSYLYTWPDKALTSAQHVLFFKKLERRISGEPVAYITGKKEFWSLSFEVNASTLIPRPETELLIDIVLQKIADQPFFDREVSNTFVEVIDLGTGTGAIALALATEKPAWQILACDVQHEAIQLAQHNVRTLGIHNVTCLVSDWFSCIQNKMFDLIVSNPPYIDSSDSHLAQGDVRFEPRSALVSGNNGLADIAKIIQQSPNYLKADGWLMLEHGFAQGEQVRALLSDSSYEAIETFVDLAGKERVTIGQKSSNAQKSGAACHG